jgi:hypothetical protein
MAFQTEFPNFPADAFPALPDTFRDASWHNDGQPSMVSEALLMHIQCDHPDVDLRESDDRSRFRILLLDLEGCVTDEVILETDEWAEVLAVVEDRLADVSPLEQLSNEWRIFTASRYPDMEIHELVESEEWKDASQHDRDFVADFLERLEAVES